MLENTMKPSLTLVLALLVGAAGVAAQTTDASADSVTFSEHVAPIIFNNCTSCHRPGEAGPFPLRTYKEVKKRGRTISRVTRSRFMPPWHPVEGHGDFADSLRLKPGEIQTIQRWVRAGMPEGDPNKLPPMPKFMKGWQLGEPDMVVKMTEPFRVPAGGRDIYRNFVVPLDLDEDKWLTAIEVRPSSRAVLHHVLFRTTRDRSIRGDDFGFRRRRGGGRGTAGGLGVSTSGLGGWAVGGQARHLPLGLAVKIPKGTNLVLSSHFHPSGKEEDEQTTLGLHFTDKPPTRTMVGLQFPPLFGALAGVNITPGTKDFKISDSFVLPVDVLGLTIGGHAHYVCKEMQMWVTPPNGQKQSVFWIDNWAFNWQNRYQFKKPLDLPKGTKIDVQLVYDNSANNPNNPFDPPRRIRWGLQSTDEMGSVTLLAVARREHDSEELQRAMRRHLEDVATSGRALRGIEGLGADWLVRVVARLDANRNGRLEKSEISYRYRRRFRKFDKNGDGDLDEQELDELKKSGRSILGTGGRRRDR